MKYIEKDVIIHKCKQFIDSNMMETLSNGKYEIEGNKFYVIIFDYVTKELTECSWEAHKKHIDIHYIISGKEVIGINDIATMDIEGYDDVGDCVKCKGNVRDEHLLNASEFLILYPEDAHITGIKMKEPVGVRKAVFKMVIEES